MTAQGVINYIEAEDLGYQVEWIASLTHQALNGITDAYNHNVQVRNIQEQVDVARMRHWLEGSQLTTRQAELCSRCIQFTLYSTNSWCKLPSFHYVREKLNLK